MSDLILTGSFRGREIYTATISGHVGYLREAMTRVPGTKEYRRGSFNGRAGINTTLTVQFDRADDALYEQFMDAYRQVLAERKAAKK
jgi:hypothetical protein